MPYSVAPFTGAWIEITFISKILIIYKRIAPFTGAWIEILISQDIFHNLWSPFTGAWIKNLCLSVAFVFVPISRTLYGCWLIVYHTIKNILLWSHPLRVRGLKYILVLRYIIGLVAPFTGAWIEIKELYG